MFAKDIALSYLQQAKEKIKPPKLGQVYGQAIGILLIDTRMTRIPGDIGNATTFSFPVRFKIVEGVHTSDILCPKPDIAVCQLFIEEARKLADEGVRAVTTSCGYFGYFQEEIAEAINVPVFTSILIQVPLVSKMIGKNKRVGVICADSKCLTQTHLRNAGIEESLPLAIAGLDKYWLMVRGQDPEKRRQGFERALTKVSNDLISNYPDIGAFVLECTNLPPGAAAVQETTGLPVFDIVTLTNMVYDVVVRKRYFGYL